MSPVGNGISNGGVCEGSGMSKFIGITAISADGSFEIEEEIETVDFLPVYTWECGSIPAEYVMVPAVDRQRRIVRDVAEIERLAATLSP
jgi:hypothetical protein